jgi:predicted lipid carrier protein YhbT
MQSQTIRQAREPYAEPAAKLSQYDLHQGRRPALIGPWRMKARSRHATAPAWIELAVRALPLPIANIVLRRLVLGIIRNHPESFKRVEPYAATVFLIEPTDFPIQFLIRLGNPEPIVCQRRPTTCFWDARISGPIASLLAMVQGALDGDALFFSREITIEGDTDAILAMRNAVDAAEINLPHELADIFGSSSPMARRMERIVMPIAERLFNAVTSRREASAI